MKLAVLSRAPGAYSTQRLKAAALDRGHKCKVLDTMRFAIELAAGEHDIVVRYVETRGYSEFRLYWELPGTFGREIIPSAALSPRTGG